jgi:hypothetical protein
MQILDILIVFPAEVLMQESLVCWAPKQIVHVFKQFVQHY